jgi:hypothetical protein
MFHDCRGGGVDAAGSPAAARRTSDGPHILATAPIVDGVATLTTTTVKNGSRQLSASDGGDATTSRVLAEDRAPRAGRKTQAAGAIGHSRDRVNGLAV